MIDQRAPKAGAPDSLRLPSMQVPNVHGLIRRRILVNFRVDPAVIQRQLPAPFRPKLHAGYAIAGICLIRLESIRPKPVPAALGISSENAAHRIAVTWEAGGVRQEGVYIPRRDTGSFLNHIVGGRLFPGEHNRASFTVREDGDRIQLRMESYDHKVQVEIAGTVGETLPERSVFATVKEASEFFEAGSLGYSATAAGDRLDGVRLHTNNWSVEPMAVEHAYSSYFADEGMFPSGSVSLDCALVMRNVKHHWEAASELYL